MISNRADLPRSPMSMGAIHSTKIPTGATGKSGPPQKVDQYFRNSSGWNEPIHRVFGSNRLLVLDLNFRFDAIISGQ